MGTLTNGLQTIDLGSATWRELHNDNATLLDPGRIMPGVIGSRPAFDAVPATPFYFATDEKKLYYNTGAAWQDISGVFTYDVANGRIIYNTAFTGDTVYTADWVVGSPTTEDDGNPDHDVRIFYDKSKGAFRAGRATSTQWNDVNRGQDSIAIGENGISSGQGSITMGYGNISSNSDSVAMGNGNTASGTTSIAIGNGNISSQNVSVAMGNGNTASGTTSIAIGNGNIASGMESFALGSNNTTSGGAFPSFALGSSNTASGWYSFAKCLESYAYLYGQQSFASGKFSAVGDAQGSKIIFRGITTNATPAEMFLDGSAVRAIIPAGKTWNYKIEGVARQTAGGAGTVGDSRIFSDFGCLKRIVNATSQPFDNGMSSYGDAAAAAWDILPEADDTNDSLKLTVTGEANKTIHWVAVVELVEVA